MMSAVWKALQAEIATYLSRRGLEVENITFVEEWQDMDTDTMEVSVQYKGVDGDSAYFTFYGTFYEFIEEMEAVESGRREPFL